MKKKERNYIICTHRFRLSLKRSIHTVPKVQIENSSNVHKRGLIVCLCTLNLTVVLVGLFNKNKKVLFAVSCALYRSSPLSRPIDILLLVLWRCLSIFVLTCSGCLCVWVEFRMLGDSVCILIRSNGIICWDNTNELCTMKKLADTNKNTFEFDAADERH